MTRHPGVPAEPRSRPAGPVRPRPARLLATLGILLLGAACAGPGGAPTALWPPERQSLAIPSGNPASFAAVLNGSAATEPSMIEGVLLMPARLPGPLPAVIIPHAESPDPVAEAYDRALIGAGIAVLRIDSFGPRGLSEAGADRGPPSPAATVYDVLAALRVLAEDARIDPRRIAVMGFGRGGAVALAAAMDDVRRAALAGDLRFVSHVALYPDCGTTWDRPRPTGQPVYMLLGEDDDLTPAERCLDFAQQIADAGGAVLAIRYRQAAHGFDRPVPLRYAADHPNFSACTWGIAEDGDIYDRATGDRAGSDYQGFLRRALPGCLRSGGHFGAAGNPGRSAMQEAVWFLYQSLSIRPPESLPAG